MYISDGKNSVFKCMRIMLGDLCHPCKHVLSTTTLSHKHTHTLLRTLRVAGKSEESFHSRA